MPDITFTLTTPQMQRLIAAMADIYGYQATLADGTSNPESMGAFARRMLIQHMQGVVRESEARLAERTARAASEANAWGSVT
jgi:hypothetical protein